jgi:hypothetical protein
MEAASPEEARTFNDILSEHFKRSAEGSVPDILPQLNKVIMNSHILDGQTGVGALSDFRVTKMYSSCFKLLYSTLCSQKV